MEKNAEKQELTKGVENERADNKRSGLRENMNPLEIPVVVQIIVSYVSKVKELKSLRMLGTCWRDETFKKWRSSAVLLINNETLPLLLQAYSVQNWENLTKEEMCRIDPFQLRKVPFKGYRFSKEQSWAYPLEDNELDKKLIWEKVIKPNAIYLDVGESAMKWYPGNHEDSKNYNYGMYWIVSFSENVEELVMAPIKSEQGLWEELEEDDDVINYVPESRSFSWLSETKAAQLESLTISEPFSVEDEDQVCSLFNDEDHQAEALAFNLFYRTPNLKNFRLKLTDTQQALSVLEGLKYSIYENIRLTSLDGLGIDSDLLSGFLESYLDRIEPENSLQELKMSFHFSDCVGTGVVSTLHYAKSNLTTLELDIDCEMKKKKAPIQTDLQLFMAYFPNLVHFKVNLDYATFPGRLLTFNLNDLKGMPSLEEFHFGTKGSTVYKAWITRKLDFDENATYPEHRGFVKLTCLKSFHFHGNFTKEALQKLGRMTENLKTLEVVLDKENFPAVKKIWPELRNLKLLPCSDVPEEDVKALEDSNPSWNVINESGNYSCALNIA